MKEFTIQLEDEQDVETLRELLASVRFNNGVKVEEQEVDVNVGYIHFAKYPEQYLMEKEVAAFEAMHEQLKQSCLGLYVAVHGGEVVDQDKDEMVLLRRIGEAYPDEIVMVDQVREQLPPDLVVRSPRFVRE